MAVHQSAGFAEVRSARVAVSLTFAVHGAVTGTFATRIPWLVDHLGIGPGALGLALIAPSLGAVATMPLTAKLTHRFRSRSTVRILMLIWCAALMLPALAPNFGLFLAAQVLYGVAGGMADVAMNAQGVVVEERYGRSIMSSLHGLWSAGGLLASGVGALAASIGVDARAHFAAMAVILAAVTLVVSRRLLNVQLPGEEAKAFALPTKGVLLVGLIGFCAVFAEGGSADWCAVYLRDVTRADPGVAATAYTAFAFAMTGGRLIGDQVIRRFGPVSSVRLGGVIGAVGVALVLLARNPVPAIIGFGLIGVGVSVVVPLAFTAAGRIGPNPTQAIAGIATIAYGAGLAAPGAIGGIAQLSSLSVSFAVVGVLLVAMVLGARALRTPDAPARSEPNDAVSDPVLG